MKKKILLGLLIIVVGIQFIRTDDEITEYAETDDFMNQTEAPAEIEKLITESCYDCHSNKTITPWYGEIAPVSWWINDHVSEGREELNFSEWGTYEYKRQDHKLEECVEMMEDGEMPLDEYTWTHREAKLTEDQKSMLMSWFEEIREETKPEENILSLNNGEKWETNIETTEGVEKMLAIIKEDVEEGRVSLYSAMGQRLDIEMKEIFSKCTMTGEGHEQLHNFLLPMVKMFRNLSDVDTEDKALVLQKDILKQLNKYNDYFISEEGS